MAITVAWRGTGQGKAAKCARAIPADGFGSAADRALHRADGLRTRTALGRTPNRRHDDRLLRSARCRHRVGTGFQGRYLQHAAFPGGARFAGCQTCGVTAASNGSVPENQGRKHVSHASAQPEMLDRHCVTVLRQSGRHAGPACLGTILLLPTSASDAGIGWTSREYLNE